MSWTFRAPKHLPDLAQLLHELGNPEPAALAKHLDVSVRSVYGWKKAGTAPRPVLLALFYESQAGQSMVATDAHNGAMYARGMAAGLERENAALRARIARIEAIADFGSANSPTMEALRPIGVSALP